MLLGVNMSEVPSSRWLELLCVGRESQGRRGDLRCCQADRCSSGPESAAVSLSGLHAAHPESEKNSPAPAHPSGSPLISHLEPYTGLWSLDKNNFPIRGVSQLAATQLCCAVGDPTTCSQRHSQPQGLVTPRGEWPPHSEEPS